jgi:hypothetical protein
VEAGELFKSLRRIELTENQRAKEDPGHIARILQMTDFSKQQPISEDMIEYFKSIQLTERDLDSESSPWLLQAVNLTASNVERIFLNFHRGLRFAMAKKEVMILFPLKLTGAAANSLSDDEILNLRRKYLELNGIFIQGAPSTLTENHKPELQLSNGAQCYMNKLIFDSEDDLYDETMDMIKNAKPGEAIYINLCPRYIIIETKLGKNVPPLQDDEKVPADIATPIYDGHTCFVMKAGTNQSNSLKNVFLEDKILVSLNYVVCWVELLFACTFDKAEG